MNPFEGRRRLDVRAEQVVWHLVSAGVLGLLLILLLFSVALLDDAAAPGSPPDPQPTIARPADDGAAAPAVMETSMRRVRSAKDACPSGAEGLSGRVRIGSVPRTRDVSHGDSIDPHGATRLLPA